MMMNRRDFILSGAATLAGFSAKGAPINSMLGANGAGAQGDGESLPYARQVQYIQPSVRGAYIDTDFVPPANVDFHLVAAQYAYEQPRYVFGQSSAAKTFSFRFHESNRRIAYLGSTNITYLSGTNELLRMYEIEKVGLKLTMRDTVTDSVYSTNLSSYTSASSNKLRIFGTKSSNSYYTQDRISEFSVSYEGKNLLDLIPVIDFDSVACMYDKVSGELFYNKGSGTFLTNEDA